MSPKKLASLLLDSLVYSSTLKSVNFYQTKRRHITQDIRLLFIDIAVSISNCNWHKCNSLSISVMALMFQKIIPRRKMSVLARFPQSVCHQNSWDEPLQIMRRDSTSYRNCSHKLSSVRHHTYVYHAWCNKISDVPPQGSVVLPKRPVCHCGLSRVSPQGSVVPLWGITCAATGHHVCRHRDQLCRYMDQLYRYGVSCVPPQGITCAATGINCAATGHHMSRYGVSRVPLHGSVVPLLTITCAATGISCAATGHHMCRYMDQLCLYGVSRVLPQGSVMPLRGITCAAIGYHVCRHRD
jgi:hypothetical protein